MAVMSDLKDAILEVLSSSKADPSNVDKMIVDKELLYILQEEFNIHFVEPDEGQIRMISHEN